MVGVRVPGESVPDAVSHCEVTRAFSRWEDSPMRLSGKSPSVTGTNGWDRWKAALQISTVIADSRLAMRVAFPGSAENGGGIVGREPLYGIDTTRCSIRGRYACC
jgi:hypothetical protein